MQATNAQHADKTKLALGRLVFDIATPIVLYYLLRSEGVSYSVALLAGAAPPALGAIVTLVTRRRMDPVAVMVVAALAAAVAVTFIAHSPRFLLAKDGLITAMWGVWFLASARGPRPAALIFAQPLMEGMRMFAGRSWDVLWASEPQFQRIWRVSTVMWGLGLLLDAATRVTISYTLPVDQVPGIGGLLYPVTVVVLQVITNVYYRRAGLYPLLGARWLERGTDRARGGGRRQPTPGAPS